MAHPRTLDEVVLWIAEHDGRIEAWWEAQRSLNERNEEWKHRTTQWMAAMEKRMMFFAGAASFVAAALGSYIGSLF